MDAMAAFRDAVIACAASGRLVPIEVAPELLHTVVLVEGFSDRAAVEALATRLGRDLSAEGVCVIPIGGAMSIARFTTALAPLDLRLIGLCDLAEERFFARVLASYFVCDTDLETEFIRALGESGAEHVIEGEGDLDAFRTFRNQPAQRDRTLEQQLHRFIGTTAGRKEQYGSAFVAALDDDRIPRPLAELMATV
jgi:hypothetical protein